MSRDELNTIERQALQWLADGQRTDEIAARLRVDVRTVRRDILKARRKLGASTAVQAVVIAVGAELIEA